MHIIWCKDGTHMMQLSFGTFFCFQVGLQLWEQKRFFLDNKKAPRGDELPSTHETGAAFFWEKVWQVLLAP